MSVELDAATDAGAFGELILGRPLWPHQLDLARSAARYRVVCAGRQVGKSTGVSVIALHEAATRASITVLLVSAGEVASRRLLEECTALAMGSALLRGSVLDDNKSILTLSNGSRIISVPASVRQIRGWPVDVLIVDEAGFVPQEVWQAAEPAIIARPGSKVILLSSPWGTADHFFRSLWTRGTDSPDEQVQSWHWPSSVSPLVDQVLLEQIRARETDEYFRREFLAEWTEEAGAYFTEDEIMSCVADYAMCAPEDLEHWLDRPHEVVAGIDWGMAADANAIVLLAPLEDHLLNYPMLRDELVFFIPWFEVKHRWAYTDFIQRTVDIGRRYGLRVVASETNGVGAYPTDDLTRRLFEADLGAVVRPVVTDVRRKQTGFGMIKGLMQQHRLVLPREPELLKQLRGLQFEQLPTGNTRISVPETLGHDDLVMALMQAVSCLRVDGAKRSLTMGWDPGFHFADPFAGATVTTPAGVIVPVNARTVRDHGVWASWPAGAESGEGW